MAKSAYTAPKATPVTSCSMNKLRVMSVTGLIS
jgi:hypothetical protein